MTPEWTLLTPDGSSKTLGVLDLGGASTQVAFAVEMNSSISTQSNDIEKLTLFNRNLAVYSTSYLCFGAQEMRNQVQALLAKVLVDYRKQPSVVLAQNITCLC